jgi:hypothetical protein
MSAIDDLRGELDRVGMSYSSAGATTYALLHDLGDAVWIKGPPLSGLSWEGSPAEALERLRGLPADAGSEKFWHALRDA